MKKASNAKKTNYVKVFLILCLIIILITIIYGYLVKDLEDRATFGDMYGALNTLFSGLAFAGLIITVIMQMRELELTRKELKKSTKAQEKSQTALNAQLKNMEASSRIETIDSYLKTLDQTNDSEKMRVSKLMLEKLSEDLFQDFKFEEILKPILKFTLNPNISYINQNVGTDNNYALKLFYQNIGSDCRIEIIKALGSKTEEIFVEEIKTREYGDTYSEKIIDGSVIKHNSFFIIYILNPNINNFDYTLSIKLTGILSKKEFRHIVKISNIEGTISHHIIDHLN